MGRFNLNGTSRQRQWYSARLTCAIVLSSFLHGSLGLALTRWPCRVPRHVVDSSGTVCTIGRGLSAPGECPETQSTEMDLLPASRTEFGVSFTLPAGSNDVPALQSVEHGTGSHFGAGLGSEFLAGLNPDGGAATTVFFGIPTRSQRVV